jgi:predicted MFS family arabinose efflux permease
MDHMGAVVGPLVAMLLLGPLALELRTVFFLTAIPAVLVVLVLILGVRERPAAAPLADAPARPRPALPTLSTWRELPAELRRLVGALLVFTLGNATDAFIALLLFESGVEMKWIALLWSLHHALKVLSTWGGGWLADRLPRRRLVILGWLIYAAIYFAFALLDGAAWQVGIFMAYAICFGIIEPAERAWVAELAGAEQRGTAFGFTSAVTGLGALPASLMFGFLWKIGGAGVAFATGATLALVAALLLALPHQERKRPTSSR